MSAWFANMALCLLASIAADVAERNDGPVWRVLLLYVSSVAFGAAALFSLFVEAA